MQAIDTWGGQRFRGMLLGYWDLHNITPLFPALLDQHTCRCIDTSLYIHGPASWFSFFSRRCHCDLGFWSWVTEKLCGLFSSNIERWASGTEVPSCMHLSAVCVCQVCVRRSPRLLPLPGNLACSAFYLKLLLFSFKLFKSDSRRRRRSPTGRQKPTHPRAHTRRVQLRRRRATLSP